MYHCSSHPNTALFLDHMHFGKIIWRSALHQWFNLNLSYKVRPVINKNNTPASKWFTFTTDKTISYLKFINPILSLSAIMLPYY